MTGYPTEVATLRIALADASTHMEQRERQSTAALTALAEECAALRAYILSATEAAEALLAQVEATALRVARREARDAVSLRALMATDAAARAYLAAVDASHAAEAAWMNAKSGRYAAQSHALACRGAMRDARTALVKALDIQTIVK